MKTASVFLDKGGVGKTTSTAHFGVALNREGLDVLLVDLAGKQGDLAKHFGVWQDLEENEDRWPNIATVLNTDWSKVRKQLPEATEQMIVATDEGPDLIPAHVGLDEVDDDLASVPVPERYQLLSEFLEVDIEPLGYDVVLIDLPGLTNNITLNGLWAAGHVIAPIEMGEFELQQMERLRKDIDELTETFDVDIEISMIVPNRVDTQTNLSEELLEELDDEWNGLIATDTIPKSQDIRNHQRRGQTIFGADELSSTARRARESYEKNSEQLVNEL